VTFPPDEHSVALAAIPDSPLCPVEAIRRLFLPTEGLHAKAPAFQVIQHKQESRQPLATT
jgi:hypothetical protein